MTTYRDGVGIERCAHCHTAIRTLTDDPIVSVGLGELERLTLGLGRVAEILAELVDGLEHITGRSIAQVDAELAARHVAEAIPRHVKTDRSGLRDDDPNQ